MATAKKILTANVHVRDPKTQELVFLPAGSLLPNGYGKIVSDAVLEKAGNQVVKPESQPIAEDVPVAPAEEPKPVEAVAPASDEELDDGESFDTE